MTPKKKAPQTKPEFKFPAQSRDLPATQGMLQLVRSELKAETKAGFRQMDSKLEQVLSEVARVGVLVEEQNFRSGPLHSGASEKVRILQRVSLMSPPK